MCKGVSLGEVMAAGLAALSLLPPLEYGTRVSVSLQNQPAGMKDKSGEVRNTGS